MIFATGWVIDVGQIIAGMAAVIAAFGATRASRKLRKESKPNGGATLKDSMNRTERSLEKVLLRLDHQDGRITEVVRAVEKTNDRLDHFVDRPR